MNAKSFELTVTQLNEYVNGMLRGDPLLSRVTVSGELSGFKRHSSGHLYFSLKDEGALVRCVMFRQNAASLSFIPRDGQSVRVAGSVSLYVRDGQFQLYATQMEQAGEGELYRRFMLLKTRLEAKGYFDPAAKKPIPRLPRCVGVVTSPTGAALQDIINVTRRRFPKMNLLIHPAPVQGEGAAGRIACAIRELNSMDRADVIIVGRGGGSMEDLWPFNEEDVARAIYESRIPIVSAVGHETDFTIADFVADLRAPTPSAAAELCVPEYDALYQGVAGELKAMQSIVKEAIGLERGRLEGIAASAAFAGARHRLDTLKRDTLTAADRMRNAVRAEAANSANAVETLSARLEALSPRSVLKRGYAMIKTRHGYAGSAAQLRIGESAKLILQDGGADITIERIDHSSEV